MHRRAAASASTPSKVSASRERRAQRTNKLKNGGGLRNGSEHGPYHSKHRADGRSAGSWLLLALGLLCAFFLLLWGGAIFHLANNSGGGSTKGGIQAAKNGLRRMRKGNSEHRSTNAGPDHGPEHRSAGEGHPSEPNQSPYTAAALEKNPYLGWQPSPNPSPLGPAFSWRECFKADPKSDGTDQPAGCDENPSELGAAPAVAKDWVPDVAMVRKMVLYGKDRDGRPFPPPLPAELCEEIEGRGGKRGDTNKECISKAHIRTTGALNATNVNVDPSNHFGATAKHPTASVVVPAPRLMCLVYTMADAHANRIRAMQQTWAGGCDGFLAFSTESDPRLPAISLEHEGEEAYGNMWQKVRSIWRFVGTHYLEDHDWFFIGGDDLFVMPHNLKTYLASLARKDGADPTTHEYFVGRRFNSGGHDYFNSGGAGYTLSQATLRTFLAAMDDTQHCSAKGHTSMEDVMIARCLKHLGIRFTDTRDAAGRERFHPFAPGSHLHWTPPGPGQAADWYEDYNKEWGILQGPDCCAPDSVSFHYIKKASMVRHMQALLYSCDGHTGR